MEYFYDYETDTLSITIGDLELYAESQEVSPGVVMHVDSHRRPLALEIHGARTFVDVTGMRTFEQKAIAEEDLARRLSWDERARGAWRALTSPHLVHR